MSAAAAVVQLLSAPLAWRDRKRGELVPGGESLGRERLGRSWSGFPLFAHVLTQRAYLADAAGHVDFGELLLLLLLWGGEQRIVAVHVPKIVGEETSVPRPFLDKISSPKQILQAVFISKSPRWLKSMMMGSTRAGGNPFATAQSASDYIHKSGKEKQSSRGLGKSSREKLTLFISTRHCCFAALPHSCINFDFHGKRRRTFQVSKFDLSNDVEFQYLKCPTPFVVRRNQK